jgi:hypothetical protein
MPKKHKELRIDKLAAQRQKSDLRKREERFALMILASIAGRRRLEGETPSVQEAFRRYLREYCDAWIECQYDVRRWPLRKRLEDDFTNLQYTLAQERGGPPRVSFLRMANGPDVSIEGTPEPDEETMLEIQEKEEKEEDQTGRVVASEYFVRFITSNVYTSIRRCKRETCSKYFVNTSGHRDAQYCSGRCARADTATKSTEMRRTRVHRETLKIVQQELDDFAKKSATARRSIVSKYGRGRWQNYIAGQANMTLKEKRLPQIKSNFITRAEGKKELTVKFKDEPWEE